MTAPRRGLLAAGGSGGGGGSLPHLVASRGFDYSGDMFPMANGTQYYLGAQSATAPTTLDARGGFSATDDWNVAIGWTPVGNRPGFVYPGGGVFGITIAVEVYSDTDFNNAWSDTTTPINLYGFIFGANQAQGSFAASTMEFATPDRYYYIAATGIAVMSMDVAYTIIQCATSQNTGTGAYCIYNVNVVRLGDS